MSATSSTRFFFSDWLSETGLRLSSLAARGLWFDLLCFMGSNVGRNFGYLKINGLQPSSETLARLVQSTPPEVNSLIAELEKNGVFSRHRDGTIYCRRMVRTQKNRENGARGGNPNLLKNNENQNPVNHTPNPLNPYLNLNHKNLGHLNGKSKRRTFDEEFGGFWMSNSKKRSKGAAYKAYVKARESGASHEEIMAGLERAKKSKQWQDPQYIPHPSTWLNNRGWEDEYDEVSQKPPGVM